MTPLAERLEQTRSVCAAALASEQLAGAEEFLARAAKPYAELLALGERFQRPEPEILRLRDEYYAAAREPFSFERALLVRTALGNLDRLAPLPVDESVRRLFCREFEFYAQPPAAALGRFAAEGHVFAAMSGIVSLTRFPAGQHQWVVSGLPRSWLPKIAPAQLPAVCAYVAFQMRGFKPYFVPHVNGTTMRAAFLSEREYYKSFHRMASALEMQPHVRGIMAGSWMLSRETHRVSPHLEFLVKPYLESGGLYADRGPAPPDDGFLAGDPARAALYHSGGYRPTFGVVFCSRRQAIAWKRAHPEWEATGEVR